ncbi:MaoC family dehydratase [Glaciecola siphonariae]|uniref:MaoC family dehydratase n=1 Tax=Glaciecola siphonariae TaxID=521012 RepID=A0ABV9LUA8_9ALTE
MDISQLNVGDTLTSPEWFQLKQQTINDFAHATGDFQWIHLDNERCKQQSPFKTTIAHGFLTAALMPKMFAQCVSIDDSKVTMLNYGIDTLRYLEPVRVNDKIRFVFSLSDIEKKPMGNLHKFNTSVEIEGREKPALIGDFLMLVIAK